MEPNTQARRKRTMTVPIYGLNLPAASTTSTTIFFYLQSLFFFYYFDSHFN